MDGLLIDDIFYVLETIGILSFSLSGVISAKRKQFDFVGVYIVACVTAFGGGTMRDLILDTQPVYWISHSEYPTILLAMVAVICLVKRLVIRESWLFLPDAMGLSLFAITTAQMAMNADLPMIVVAILATIVASFGGVIRDVLCQEVPTIFKRETPMYASLAFLGACLYVGLTEYFAFSVAVNMVVSSLAIFGSRLLVRRFHIVLAV